MRRERVAPLRGTEYARARIRENARVTRGAVSIFELVTWENFTTATVAANREWYVHAIRPRRSFNTFSLYSKFRFVLPRFWSALFISIDSPRDLRSARSNDVKSRSRMRRSTHVEIVFITATRDVGFKAPSCTVCSLRREGIFMRQPRNRFSSFYNYYVCIYDNRAGVSHSESKDLFWSDACQSQSSALFFDTKFLRNLLYQVLKIWKYYELRVFISWAFRSNLWKQDLILCLILSLIKLQF